MDFSLYSPKFKIMYLDLVNVQVNNDFGIVPYFNLNDLNQERVNDLFPQEWNLHESYVLYKTVGNSVLILGYFILDNTHITNSTIFESLQRNTINYLGVNHLPLIQNERCVHLRTWIFDKQLGNEQGLKRVFSYITNIIDNPPYILWCEDGNDLLFYNVKDELLGNSGAVAYFSTQFRRV